MKTNPTYAFLLAAAAACFAGCTSLGDGSGGPQTTLQGAEGLNEPQELDSGFTLTSERLIRNL